MSGVDLIIQLVLLFCLANEETNPENVPGGVQECRKPSLLACAVSSHVCLGKLEPPCEKQDLWYS